MKPALRTPLLNVHLWAGLVTGLVMVVVALSGAVLVFRDKLERPLDAARFVVAPGNARLSADELVARGRAANPGVELESVRYFGDPTAPFLVYFKDKRYVHLNPYTGAVLGLRARYGDGFGWVEGLHKYLTLEPTTGETLNGSLALVFAGIALTGVVLWWPATRRALQAGLTLNRKLSGRPWHLNLHKTLGFYAALILLFSALSGVPIALDTAKNLLYPLTFSTKPPLPSAEQTAGPHLGFEAIAQRLQGLMPGARESYIPLPKNGLVASYAIAADSPHPVARSYAYFEAATGRLLRHTPYEQAAAGFRLYYWMMAVHMGVTGGWWLKIILLFGSLAVPVLAYTGTASYLQRRAAKAARSAGAAAAKRSVATTVSST